MTIEKVATTEPGDAPVWADLPRVGEPVYGIDETPPTWLETLLYGWQHTLVDISPFVLPLGRGAARE